MRELLASYGFGGFRLLQLALYLHPFDVGYGARLVQRLETTVGVLRLLQRAQRSAMRLVERSGVDGGEHLSLAHSVAFVHAYARDVAAQFETKRRTRLLFYSAYVVFCLAAGVGASYGEGLHLNGGFTRPLLLFGAARQHRAANEQRH